MTDFLLSSRNETETKRDDQEAAAPGKTSSHKKKQKIVSSVCDTTHNDLPGERFSSVVKSSALLAKINNPHYTTFYK